MKLRSHAFEQEILRQLRPIIDRSPLLHREAEIAKAQKFRIPGPSIPVRILFSLILLPALCFVWWQISPGTAMGVLALWGILLTLQRAIDFAKGFGLVEGLRIHLTLPLSDAELFRLQWQNLLPRTAFLFVDFAVAYLITMALTNASWPHVLAALVFAGIQWLLSLALAIYLASRLQFLGPITWARDRLILVLVAVVIGLTTFLNYHHADYVLYPLIASAASVIAWICPQGWVNSAYYLGVLKGDAWMFLALVPIAAIIATSRHRQRKLKEMLCFGASSLTEMVTQSTATRPTHESSAPAWTPGAMADTGPTAVTDDIAEKRYTELPDWSGARFLERGVFSLLNPREKILLSIGRPDAPQWSAFWKWAVKSLAVTTGLALAAGMVDSGWFFWVFYLGCAPAATCVLLLPDFQWPGFGIHRIVNSRIKVYALLPIDQREISGLMAKICFVRFAAALPVLAIAGGVAGWMHQIGAAVGVLRGLELGLVTFASWPLLLTMSMANGLRQVRTLRCRLLFAGILLAGGTMLVVWILAVSASGLFHFGALVLTATLSRLVHAIFIRAYDRGWFDPDGAPNY